MRILILSQYYAPEPIPKPSDLAESLQQKGHTVSVVTGLPNYPNGVLYPRFRKRLVQLEASQGISVVRTFEYPYHGKSSIGRVINYLSFMLTAPLGSLFVAPCDVIYVWHPPLTIGLAAWLISRLHRIPFVYDVQDIWPESVVISGMLRNKRIIQLLSKVETFVYSRAARIFVVTRGARENLLGKGVNPNKVLVMPHWIDETKFARVECDEIADVRQSYGWADKFVSLFAGNLGVVQGLETIIRAAALLPRNRGFLVSLIGDGADKRRLKALAESLDVNDRVQFIDRRGAEDMPAIMAAADALLVHLKAGPLSNWVIPAKTFAYLSAARPIVMAVGGAAAEMIRDSRAGLVVPPEDEAALSRGIQSLRDLSIDERLAMGKRGREFLIVNFSKRLVMAKYEQELQDVASGTH